MSCCGGSVKRPNNSSYNMNSARSQSGSASTAKTYQSSTMKKPPKAPAKSSAKRRTV